MNQVQHRTFGSRSQERTYQDKKKLSKLFRKAGAGRFSQNIPTIKQNELSGDLYSWGISQDGVLGHEDTQDDEDIKSEGIYLSVARPIKINFFLQNSIKITKMS